MNKKLTFKFTMPNGTIVEAITDDDLKKLGVYEERKDDLEAHYVSGVYNERIWRDKELDLTDKMMFEDSTYKGIQLFKIDIHQQVLDYRQRLRDYDLKYQPRPERPEWFKD